MSALQQLLRQRSDLWRGGRLSEVPEAAVSTGYVLLDEKLVGGGWPVGGITELLTDAPGHGELELLLPFLASLPKESGWIALVAPPFQPYAPAFSAAGISLESMLWINTADTGETAWALEQTLRSGFCSAVLGWPQEISVGAIRRLQLAAEEKRCCGFLFRHKNCARQASMAKLRLQVQRSASGFDIEILKRRGGWSIPPFHLS